MIEAVENLFEPFLTASRDAAMFAVVIGLVLWITGKRIPPAWRHALWLLVAVRLMLPTLPESPTSWQRFLPEKSYESAARPPAIAKSAGESETATVANLAELEVTDSPTSELVMTREAKRVGLEENFKSEATTSAFAWWSWRQILAVIWFAGSVTMLGMIAVMTLRFRRRVRRLEVAMASPNGKDGAARLAAACAEAGICRIPRWRVTEAVSTPALTGLWRPEILLPPSAVEKLSDEELRLVLLHELGHLRRCDLWVSWAQSLLQALHWFNPLVWWAFHRSRIESERACDDWVLRRAGVGRAGDYGEALLRLLESATGPRPALPGVVGVLESRRDLRVRLAAIGKFSGRGNRWAVALAVAMLGALVALGLTQVPAPKSNPETKDLADNPNSLKVEIEVVSKDGEPRPGSEVLVTTESDTKTDFSSPVLASGSTDEKGKFGAQTIPLPEYHRFANLYAIARTEDGEVGFMWAQAERDVAGAAWSSSAKANVRLNAAKELKVRVLHPDGRPAGDLELWVDAISIPTVPENRHLKRVWLNPPKLPGGFWNGRTDSDGFCTIRDVPQDAFVHLKHAREEWAAFPGYHHILMDGLEPGVSEQTLDLVPAASIGGRVTLPDGQPAAGVRVQVIEVTPYRVAHSEKVMTDSDGAYRLSSLPATTYRLTVRVNGDASEKWVGPGEREISVGRGERKENVDIELKPVAIVTGRLVNAATGEEIGAPIRWKRPEGTQELYFSGRTPKGFHANREKIEVTVKGGERRTVDIKFSPIDLKDHIAGKVVDDKGDPVPGASIIRLEPASPFREENLFETDEEGRFEIVLKEETNTLKLFAWKEGMATPEPMDFKRGEEASMVIRGDVFAKASGKVVDENGDPIDGVTVSWMSDLLLGQGSAIAREVRTGRNGKYAFDRVAPGQWVSFFAKKEGFSVDRRQMKEVASGQSVEVPEMKLTRADSAIAGTVVDTAGKPVPHARVSIEGYLQPSEKTAFTDEQGRFEIEGLANRWLWVEVSSRGEQPSFIRHRARAGRDDVVVTLPSEPYQRQKENFIDYQGKPAPPLKAKKWFHSEPLSEDHRGKIRVLQFMGIDRSLIFFSKVLPSLQQLRDEYPDESDLEVIAVHGPWPEQEVTEILKSDYPDSKVPLVIESDDSPMSAALGVKHWLTLVIDRDGKVVFQDTGDWKEAKAKVAELLGKSPDAKQAAAGGVN